MENKRLLATYIGANKYEAFKNREGKEIPEGITIEFSYPYNDYEKSRGKLGDKVEKYNFNKYYDIDELYEELLNWSTGEKVYITYEEVETPYKRYRIYKTIEKVL